MRRYDFRTKLCELLEIEYPIILAGMASRGKATPPALVAAVSNAGGLGVMGGAGLDPEEIRGRIQEIRLLTDKSFGVDLLLPVTVASTHDTRSAVRQQLLQEYPKHVEFVFSLMRKFNLPETKVKEETFLSPEHIKKQVEVVLEEKVPVFAAGLGDPSWVIPRAHEQGMKIIGLAGSVRNAQRHMEAGVDIVVAQGTEAGGHTGTIANFPLIPQVVDAVKPIPVVAAGGIADGRGVAGALALGAVGVWIGTAFLVAEECIIPGPQKEQILGGKSEDFVPSRTYTGKTARNYRNAVIQAWEESGLDPLPMPLQGILMEDFTAAAREVGRYDLVNNPSGQVGGMLRKGKPAAIIMDELIKGAVETIKELQSSVSG